jgi:hypothetical protein
MAFTYTRNLKLKLNSNLTAEAKYNLERIDLLGSTFLTDSTDSLNIRSRQDINITPDSADLGGSSTGGAVNIGNSAQSLDSLNIWTDLFNLSGQLGLLDQASGGTKYLRLKYKSDITGSADTALDRSLAIDLNGADRNISLAGNLTTVGGNFTFNTAAGSDITVPATGTLATLAGLETLTNKTINAADNFLSNIRNSNIASDAGIAYSKLNLSGSITNADIVSAAGIPYSKLTLTGNLVNADINAAAAIARSKIASGTANHVVINDGSGNLSSEAFLSPARGGFGFDSTGLVFPENGSLISDTAIQTLTNKTISGSNNTLSNIAYSSLNLTGGIVNTDVANNANIAYGKLSLSGQLINSDISASAAIARTKLASGSANYVLINDGSGVASSEAQLAISRGGTNADNAIDALNNLLPDQAGNSGKFLSTDGAGAISWETVAGSGTVTSVDLTAPAIFTVSGNPITTSGTLDLSLAVQDANKVWAGPTNGADAEPTFRALVLADLPANIDHGGLAGLSDDDHTQYHTDARALTWLGTRSTSDLPEGTNEYYTDAKVTTLLSGIDINTAADSGLAGGSSIDADVSLSIDPTNAPSATIASDDTILFADASDSDSLKKSTIAGIISLIPSGKAVATWASGDGAGKVVIHNFGTLDVSITVYDIDSGEDIMVDSIVRTDTNTVTLAASEAPTGSGWRIIVRN